MTTNPKDFKANERYVDFKTARLLERIKFPDFNFTPFYDSEEKRRYKDTSSWIANSHSSGKARAIPCPTQALAIRFLRECYGLQVEAHTNISGLYVATVTKVPSMEDAGYIRFAVSTYEGALEGGITFACNKVLQQMKEEKEQKKQEKNDNK